MKLLTVNWPAPGRYILAVSGGADSMALLSLFTTQEYKLVVAHFDHGLRLDSAQDLEFVRAAAERYHLPFESRRAQLRHASEADARAVRYRWLEQVRRRHGALAVLTAHHQDDLIETSLLNLARGTSRTGLAPMLGPNATVLRPLLGISRTQLREYALQNSLIWHEDPTNADRANPRNFLRHELLSSASAPWRQQYVESIAELARLNETIQLQVDQIFGIPSTPATYQFSRTSLKSYGPVVTQELIVAASRRLCPGIQLDRKLLEEVAQFAVQGLPGKWRPLRQGLRLCLTRDLAKLTTKSPG